jgi:hypothetical protein
MDRGVYTPDKPVLTKHIQQSSASSPACLVHACGAALNSVLFNQQAMLCCAKLPHVQSVKIQCVPAPYLAALSTVVASKGVCPAAATNLLLESEKSCKQWPRSLICHAARGKGGRNSMPAATDAAGLLQALVQLASRTTIIVGSHQAYVGG